MRKWSYLDAEGRRVDSPRPRSSHATDQLDRQCTACLMYKGKHCFPLRARGTRSTICNGCHSIRKGARGEGRR